MTTLSSDNQKATRYPSLAGRTLDRYFHVCAFFDDRDDEYRVLGPFYKEGVEGGDKILHFVDGKLLDDHKTRLCNCGIDVEACEQREQMAVLTWEQAYFAGGAFDTDKMLRVVDETLRSAEGSGYPRLRIMGNMSWAARPGVDELEVIRYESLVNEVLTKHRQLAVCVYDSRKLTGHMMLDILRTHPLTLVGGIVHENPFYTPPDQVLSDLRARRERVTPRA